MSKDEFNALLKQHIDRRYPSVPNSVDADVVSNLNLTVTQLAGLLQKYASSTISSEEKKLFNMLKDDLNRDIINIPDSEDEFRQYYKEVVKLTESVENL